jgi:hypothetical protein
VPLSVLYTPSSYRLLLSLAIPPFKLLLFPATSAIVAEQSTLPQSPPPSLAYSLSPAPSPVLPPQTKRMTTTLVSPPLVLATPSPVLPVIRR